MRSLQRLFMVIVGLAWPCFQVALAAPSYTVSEPHPEAKGPSGGDLDDKGHMAFFGFVEGVMGEFVPGAFVCKETCRRVPPPPGNGPQLMEVYAMNNRGQVAGFAWTTHHAFLSDVQTTIDLGVFPQTDGCGFSCQAGSHAYGINDKGQVVGDSGTSDGFSRAALWDGGVIHKLPTLGGDNGSARAINNHGAIVGYAETVPGTWGSHAFLYHRGKMHDLGVLPGGTTSSAWDVNDAGQVVGWSDTATAFRPFIYSDGAMKEIPTPPGALSGGAVGINGAGWVVGYLGLPDSGDDHVSHGFVFDGTATYDLNDVIPAEDRYGLPIGGAVAINTQGQILVWTLGDVAHYLLLTPQP